MCVMTELTESAVTVADQRRTVRCCRPTDWRLSVWRGFLRTHSHLISGWSRICRPSTRSHWAATTCWSSSPRRRSNRLRMSDLAEAVLLSRSGLTRLVDRMQKRRPGAARAPDPADARGLYTVLTDKGRTCCATRPGFTSPVCPGWCWTGSMTPNSTAGRPDGQARSRRRPGSRRGLRPHLIRGRMSRELHSTLRSFESSFVIAR